MCAWLLSLDWEGILVAIVRAFVLPTLGFAASVALPLGIDCFTKREQMIARSQPLPAGRWLPELTHRSRDYIFGHQLLLSALVFTYTASLYGVEPDVEGQTPIYLRAVVLNAYSLALVIALFAVAAALVMYPRFSTDQQSAIRFYSNGVGYGAYALTVGFMIFLEYSHG